MRRDSALERALIAEYLHSVWLLEGDMDPLRFCKIKDTGRDVTEK